MAIADCGDKVPGSVHQVFQKNGNRPRAIIVCALSPARIVERPAVVLSTGRWVCLSACSAGYCRPAALIYVVRLDGDGMTASRKKKEDARKRPLSPGWCVAWEITPHELLLFLLRNGEAGLLERSVAEYECQLVSTLGLAGFALAVVAAESNFSALDLNLGAGIQLATTQGALGLLDLLGRHELMVTRSRYFGIFLLGRKGFRTITAAEIDFSAFEVCRRFCFSGSFCIHYTLDTLEIELGCGYCGGDQDCYRSY